MKKCVDRAYGFTLHTDTLFVDTNEDIRIDS